MEGLQLFEAVRCEVETTLTQQWELVKSLSLLQTDRVYVKV